MEPRVELVFVTMVTVFRNSSSWRGTEKIGKVVTVTTFHISGTIKHGVIGAAGDQNVKMLRHIFPIVGLYNGYDERPLSAVRSIELLSLFTSNLRGPANLPNRTAIGPTNPTALGSSEVRGLSVTYPSDIPTTNARALIIKKAISSRLVILDTSERHMAVPTIDTSEINAKAAEIKEKR